MPELDLFKHKKSGIKEKTLHFSLHDVAQMLHPVFLSKYM